MPDMYSAWRVSKSLEMWRAGEGQVKLWVVVVAYFLSASFFRDVLVRTGWQRQLGTQLFLPEAIGWAGTLALLFVVIAAWYAFAQWNERAKKFAAI